jgi:hypothetical protein
MTPVSSNTPSPSIRVDVHDDKSVAYWCGRLECSQEQLAYCVMKVGSSSNAVSDYLEMNHDRFDRYFDQLWKETKNN